MPAGSDPPPAIPSPFPQMAKKPTETAPETPAAPSPTIRVRALCVLGEAGELYLPGNEFDTTPERATALGDTVVPVN